MGRPDGATAMPSRVSSGRNAAQGPVREPRRLLHEIGLLLPPPNVQGSGSREVDSALALPPAEWPRQAQARLGGSPPCRECGATGRRSGVGPGVPLLDALTPALPASCPHVRSRNPATIKAGRPADGSGVDRTGRRDPSVARRSFPHPQDGCGRDARPVASGRGDGDRRRPPQWVTIARRTPRRPDQFAYAALDIGGIAGQGVVGLRARRGLARPLPTHAVRDLRRRD